MTAGRLCRPVWVAGGSAAVGSPHGGGLVAHRRYVRIGVVAPALLVQGISVGGEYGTYSGSPVGVGGAVGEPHPRPLAKREGSLMTSTPTAEPL